jgi:hypothetical protein
MNFLTVKPSLSAVNVSDALRLCSSRCWLVRKCPVFTRSLTSRLWSAT